MGIVYTLGHGNRSFPDFLECLRSFEIEVVADVRSYPASRQHPAFDREPLEAALAENRVTYRWFGQELGGFRAGGYEEHMQTELYRRGIARVLGLLRDADAALLCAEIDPGGCHRRFLAADLAGRGYEVRHVIEPGRFLLPGERPEDQGTLFPL